MDITLRRRGMEFSEYVVIAAARPFGQPSKLDAINATSRLSPLSL